ncbi:MAG: hypothetical protein QXY12_02560 [Pyrobaculum sp.]
MQRRRLLHNTAGEYLRRHPAGQDRREPNLQGLRQGSVACRRGVGQAGGALRAGGAR